MPNTIRTKATQKRLDSSAAAFNARYSSPSQYGESRWKDSLYPALLQPTQYTALVNQFVPREELNKAFAAGDISPQDLREVGFPSFCQKDEQTASTQGRPVVCYQRIPPDSEDVNGAENIKNNRRTKTLPFPPPGSARLNDKVLLTHWNMDAASVLAALTLRVRPGDRVLDLCAAPGGKSVVLAQQLWPDLHHASSSPQPPSPNGDRTCLHCNELDTNRNKRLTVNLQSYLPPQLFSSTTPQVKILKLDASSAKTCLPSLPFNGPSLEKYDKVLVDAPCSSERHILHTYSKASAANQISDEMMNWKPSHSTTLSKTQVGLLTTALRAVKIGGRVVYATCALGVEENDGVVDTVLTNLRKEHKKINNTSTKTHDRDWNWDIEIEILSPPVVEDGNDDEDTKILNNMTESTKYGRIALPDRAAGAAGGGGDGGGWGPLYFCVLNKVALQTKRKKKQKSGVGQITRETEEQKEGEEGNEE